MKKSVPRSCIGVLTFTAVFVLSLAINATTVSAASTSTHPQQTYRPRDYRLKMHTLGSLPSSSVNRSPKAAVGLATWSSSFTYKGKSYPYTMVGTNPASGSQTTTIPVDIIPLNLVFTDGVSLNGQNIASTITGSAIFQDAPFVTGTTQYLDAFQRGAFWSSVAKTSPDYHVLLGTPTVKPTVTLRVPLASGSHLIDSKGKSIGLVDIRWFSPKADQLTAQNNAPDHLVVFLALNIYEYEGNPTLCCIGGYHTAVQNNGHTYTYVYAAYDQAADVFKDIDALSHEIAEWGSDPLINNMTPNWYASGYGCSNMLEVGDPAVGTDFLVNGLHFQDEVNLSWFARETPSQGYQGRYDYLDKLFHSPAKDC